MIVGAKLSNENGHNTKRTEPAQLWMKDPKYRHDRADGHHMTRGKCGEARPGVKWIEAVNVVSDKRRIVLHPRLGPSAAKCKLQGPLSGFEAAPPLPPVLNRQGRAQHSYRNSQPLSWSGLRIFVIVAVQSWLR